MINELINYETSNIQELNDLGTMIDFESKNQDSFMRSNKVAHFSASCWIVNNDYSKVLMCYHNIYKSYSWCGGHNDGNRDFKQVCLKEAMEETGLKNIKFVSDKPLSIEILPVNSHYKNNSFVSNHLHMNISYLLIADDREKCIIKEDENSDLRWFNVDEVLDYVDEPLMIPIYQKIIEKVKLINENNNISS